jgi:hypothetical protein
MSRTFKNNFDDVLLLEDGAAVEKELKHLAPNAVSGRRGTVIINQHQSYKVKVLAGVVGVTCKSIKLSVDVINRQSALGGH